MKRPVGVIVVALVASMAMAGMALAEDADDTTETTMTMVSPLITVDEEGKMVIALPDEDGILPECEPVDGEGEEGEEVPAPEAGEEGEEGEEGELVEPVTYGPGECIEFTVDHPSGKMHHGAIVSTVAKGLHPSMLDGIKKGQIMRHVAKYNELPPEVEGVDDDGDDDGDDEPKAEADKPAKGNSDNAKNKDKPNKGKKNR